MSHWQVRAVTHALRRQLNSGNGCENITCQGGDTVSHEHKEYKSSTAPPCRLGGPRCAFGQKRCGSAVERDISKGLQTDTRRASSNSVC